MSYNEEELIISHDTPLPNTNFSCHSRSMALTKLRDDFLDERENREIFLFFQSEAIALSVDDCEKNG